MKTINGIGKLYTKNHKYLCDTYYSISKKRDLHGRADVEGTISDIDYSIGQNLAGNCILRLDDGIEVDIVILDARGVVEGYVNFRVNSIPLQARSDV